MASGNSWKQTAKKVRKPTRREIGSSDGVEKHEIDNYVAAVRKRSGIQSLWAGEDFERHLDSSDISTPDISLSTSSSSERRVDLSFGHSREENGRGQFKSTSISEESPLFANIHFLTEAIESESDVLKNDMSNGNNHVDEVGLNDDSEDTAGFSHGGPLPMVVSFDGGMHFDRDRSLSLRKTSDVTSTADNGRDEHLPGSEEIAESEIEEIFESESMATLPPSDRTASIKSIAQDVSADEKLTDSVSFASTTKEDLSRHSYKNNPSYIFENNSTARRKTQAATQSRLYVDAGQQTDYQEIPIEFQFKHGHLRSAATHVVLSELALIKTMQQQLDLTRDFVNASNRLCDLYANDFHLPRTKR